MLMNEGQFLTLITLIFVIVGFIVLVCVVLMLFTDIRANKQADAEHEAEMKRWDAKHEAEMKRWDAKREAAMKRWDAEMKRLNNRP